MDSSPIAADGLIQLIVGLGDEGGAATKLVVTAPQFEGYVIGRSDPISTYQPDVDLAIYGARERGISRRHAAFVNYRGQVYLLDLDSMNGTFINGNRLQPRAARPLYDGDRVRLANLRFVVRQ